MIFNIDTLYLSSIKNSFEFATFLSVNPFFSNSDCTIIGKSKNYFWYNFDDNFRIGLSIDHDITMRSGNFFVIIQFNNSYTFGKSFNDIYENLPFKKSILNWYISRIDLNFVIDFVEKPEFDLLQKLVLSHTFRRTNTIGNTNGIIETRYLGTRKNGFMLRIYNKSKELDDVSSFKVFSYEQYFENIDNLTTFEIEIHRKYLKHKNISTLFNSDNFIFLYNYFLSILKDLRFYENTIENITYIKSENYDYVEFVSPFSHLIFDSFFPLANFKKYKPSIPNLIEKIKRLLYLYNVDIETLYQYLNDPDFKC